MLRLLNSPAIWTTKPFFKTGYLDEQSYRVQSRLEFVTRSNRLIFLTVCFAFGSKLLILRAKQKPNNITSLNVKFSTFGSEQVVTLSPFHSQLHSLQVATLPNMMRTIGSHKSLLGTKHPWAFRLPCSITTTPTKFHFQPATRGRRRKAPIQRHAQKAPSQVIRHWLNVRKTSTTR